MVNYNELYEYLRKEKYSENLQALPKNFISEFSAYLQEKKKEFSVIAGDVFADELLKEKKQFENAVSIFRELMLRRKRKILNLVFVAAETGIMKRDYTDMLSFEQNLFENLVSAINDSEKLMNESLNGRRGDSGNKMIIMIEDVDKFIDLSGDVVGPFKSGELVNINNKVADILVSGEKARFVDE